MKTSSLLQQLATALALADSTSATAIYQEPSLEVARAINAWKRATPAAPNGYTPGTVDCPSTRPSIRVANGLSDEETSWLDKRRPNTISSMRDFLVRMNITGFDAGAYIDSNSKNSSALPNVAIAVSGGGWRALMNGAGALAAYDNRTPNATNTGQLGGLLQSATYLAGLSGGGWLVGSLFVNNYTSVQAILNTTPQESGSLWQFSNSILEGPDTGGIQILSTVQYYDDLYDTVNAKADAPFNFNTSLTDYWGRALSFQLINATDGGPAYTWSSIANDNDFAAGKTPMPILVADGRAPGEVLISGNATNYEFNPWEMGSFDPTVYGFAPLKYVGSNFTGGSIDSNQQCVEGFDNAGFVMGTSSSLFNQLILNLNSTNAPEILKSVVSGILEDLGQDQNDIADWTPNPFYHFNNKTNPNANTKRLTLVDGGEDLQNIPLNPLIQPIRHVDVIFAVDSSADTTADNGAANWPNGTALVATYQRSLNETIENGTAFPAIPDQNTFVNLGLNTRPTFFGCDSSNLTGDAPLVVYVPNTPYVYNSNVSTFTLTYNNTERNAIIENGYDVATMGNGTLDADFPVCVGCAVLSRSLERTGTTVPDACKKCFTKYCWDGTVNSTNPGKWFPDSKLAQLKVSAGGKFVPNVMGVVAALGAALFLVL